MAPNEVRNIERPTDPVHQKKFMVKQISREWSFEKRYSAQGIPLAESEQVMKIVWNVLIKCWKLILLSFFFIVLSCFNAACFSVFNLGGFFCRTALPNGLKYYFWNFFILLKILVTINSYPHSNTLMCIYRLRHSMTQKSWRKWRTENNFNAGKTFFTIIYDREIFIYFQNDK